MDFKDWVQMFEEAGYEPLSYSGRGMYGKTCLGVHTDGTEINVILDLIGSIYERDLLCDLQENLEPLCNCKQDQLGLGNIVYFPGIPWEELEDAASDFSDEPEDID